jgi:hypothetical protein
VDLALRRAGADRPPCDQIGDVLGRDHVQVFGAGGQLELVDLEQDAARETKALVDPEAVVEPRVVDEALPTHGRARLLEVHAHHHDQLIGELALDRGKARGVIDSRVVVVDRARPTTIRSRSSARAGRGGSRRVRRSFSPRLEAENCPAGAPGGASSADVADSGVVDGLYAGGTQAVRLVAVRGRVLKGGSGDGLGSVGIFDANII